MRYGDDFILVEPDLQKLRALRREAFRFLEDQLKLKLNPNSDKILKTRHGLKFLGVVLWPNGRGLNKRNVRRIYERLTLNNAGSYYGEIKHYANDKKTREFHWYISEKISVEEF